jgi:MFS transporter, DHA2 family, glioxin efflux transporter
MIVHQVLTDIIVFQTVGGAFTVSSGQAAFINQALDKLHTSAPGVDDARLIATGASELRQKFTSSELPGVIIAYMHGLKAVFAVSIGFLGIAFLTTLVIPWARLPTHTSDNEKKDSPPIAFV